ncbi:hypothetical protein BGZ72_008225 [Mortierella alpina]|nr:hypothetical protein BGZ72_008225 [Mortierella alpina]
MQHRSVFKSTVYSPDGEHIISASDDKTVRMWDRTSGDSVLELKHRDKVTSVAYSTDGLQIAAGNGSKVQLWDAKTGAKLEELSGHTDSVTIIIYSPNGLQIASTGDDRTLRIWSATTGEALLTFSGHVNSIISVEYSPDGKQIATVSLDKTVRLWTLPDDDEIDATESKEYSRRYQKKLTSNRDKRPRSHNVRLSGHTDPVTSVTYSPDGFTLASGGFDKTVRLWNAKTGELIKMLVGYDQQAMSASVNETTSASINQAASFSINQTAGVNINQTPSDNIDQTVSNSVNQTMSVNVGRIERIVYSPSGEQIALGSDDACVYILDVETGGLIHKLVGHDDPVTSVAYSPDGKMVASGSDDWTVYLWNVGKGIALYRLVEHNRSVTDVAYSPCGKQVASASSDKRVILWDTATGEVVMALAGHAGMVTSVVYSPNGRWIASGSNDKTICIWDIARNLSLELKGHTDKVSSVAFSPTSEEIASGSLDNSVRVWEVASGQLKALVKVIQSPVTSIAWVKYDSEKKSFNRNSLNENDLDSYLAVTSNDKSVRVWKVKRMESELHVQLHWNSTRDRLVVSGAELSTTQGLSDINKRLMEQQDAKGIPPGAGEEQMKRSNQDADKPIDKFRLTGENIVRMSTVVDIMKKEGSNSAPCVSCPADVSLLSPSLGMVPMEYSQVPLGLEQEALIAA